MRLPLCTLRGFEVGNGFRASRRIASGSRPLPVYPLSGQLSSSPALRIWLLSDSHPGDVLLVEQVDRLSRLGAADWDRLKVELAARKVRVVALDLPTSWTMATTGKVNDFTARMFEAINGMLLDMLAAVARKDYEDRRCRQMQGQAKAKAEGKSSAAWRIRSATPRSRPCCGLARPTALYRMQPAAAARRSPRSRSAISGSLNQIASGRILAAVRLTAAPRCAREAAADSARVALSERRIYDESIG